jgi:hypothetical protein
VSHVRAGPVTEDEQVARIAGPDQQGGDLSPLRRGEEFQLLCFGSHFAVSVRRGYGASGNHAAGLQSSASWCQTVGSPAMAVGSRGALVVIAGDALAFAEAEGENGAVDTLHPHPQGRVFLTLVSAIPPTLAGTCFLLFTILGVSEARPSTNPSPLTPKRSLLWYATGAIGILIYGLVLGPGVPC